MDYLLVFFALKAIAYNFICLTIESNPLALVG